MFRLISLFSIAAGKLLPSLSYEQYINHRGQQNIHFGTKQNNMDTLEYPTDSLVLEDRNTAKTEMDFDENSENLEDARGEFEKGDFESLIVRPGSAPTLSQLSNNLYENDVLKSSQKRSQTPDVDIFYNCNNQNDANHLPIKLHENSVKSKNPTAVKNLAAQELPIDTDNVTSAFTPLKPGARVTPVKFLTQGASVTPIQNSEPLHPSLSLIAQNDDFLDDSPLRETPARVKHFDPKTPYNFAPETSSTPVLNKNGGRNSEQDFSRKSLVIAVENLETSQAAADWLAEPDSQLSVLESGQTFAESLPNPTERLSPFPEKSIELKTRPISVDSRKISTDSRCSRQSQDLFDSSCDAQSLKQISDHEEKDVFARTKNTHHEISDSGSSATNEKPRFRKRKLDLGSDVSPIEEKLSRRNSTESDPPVLSRRASSTSLRSSDSPMPLLEQSAEKSKLAQILAAKSDITGNSERDIEFSPLPDFDDILARQEEKDTKNISKTIDNEKISPKKAMRAGDPNFVSEFYNNSRLHHLSTWGAEFRDYVNHLQSSGDTSFPGRTRLAEHLGLNQSVSATSRGQNVSQSERVVMHIDMDCFFVSVGLRNRPHLKGN